MISPFCKDFIFMKLRIWHPPRSAVGNVSGYRCVSDCRSRGREFDPGPVPYFRGDWSWNNFYGHSPPFRCPGKSVVKWTDRPAMTIAVDMGRKATKTKTNKAYDTLMKISGFTVWVTALWIIPDFRILNPLCEQGHDWENLAMMQCHMGECFPVFFFRVLRLIEMPL